MSLAKIVILLMAIGRRITHLEERHDAGRRFWRKVGKVLQRLRPW